MGGGEYRSIFSVTHLSVGLALGVEVGATLSTAHGETGKRVLEDLLEAEELDDGKVHSGVKTETTLKSVRKYRLSIGYEWNKEGDDIIAQQKQKKKKDDQANLVGADSTVVLDTEATVDLDVTVVVEVGDTRDNEKRKQSTEKNKSFPNNHISSYGTYRNWMARSGSIMRSRTGM